MGAQPLGSRTHLYDHGQEFPIRLQFEHDQRGGQVLLAAQDDIGLDPVQEREVRLEQCACLRGGGGWWWLEGEGCYHFDPVSITPSLPAPQFTGLTQGGRHIAAFLRTTPHVSCQIPSCRPAGSWAPSGPRPRRTAASASFHTCSSCSSWSFSSSIPGGNTRREGRLVERLRSTGFVPLRNWYPNKASSFQESRTFSGDGSCRGRYGVGSHPRLTPAS